MRQYVYTSRSTTRCSRADLDAILHSSRHNNAIDGLSGFIWTDGTLFLQVLEGDDEAVSALIVRLKTDPRHRDIAVLIDRDLEAREFGSWSMAFRFRGEDSDEFSDRVRALVAGKSSEVRENVEALLGRAAAAPALR